MSVSNGVKVGWCILGCFSETGLWGSFQLWMGFVDSKEMGLVCVVCIFVIDVKKIGMCIFLLLLYKIG